MNSIPHLPPHFPASILGGQVPGPYERKTDGAASLVHPPSWIDSGKNPYARD